MMRGNRIRNRGPWKEYRFGEDRREEAKGIHTLNLRVFQVVLGKGMVERDLMVFKPAWNGGGMQSA
jgi:hypothetical protein